MEAAWVDSGLLDALTRRAGRSLQTENAVQRDPHSRRIRGQSATWRTALWAAFATALIFLVVKCTVRLPNRAEASVRMLAEGGGDWDDGERQPLLQRVFDEEGGPCMTGTTVGRRGSQRGGGSFFNRLRSSFSSPTGRRSGGKGYKTFENPPPRPSTSAADSGGTADQASNQRATRRRVQHETDVQTGVFHSPHYMYPNQYYPFPRLGRGYESLRRMLWKMQETAKDICHPHGDLRSEQFHAKYTLRDGTGSLKIVITIIESTINDVGAPDPRPRAFYPDGFDWSSLHFARDVACVTEEMITKLIAGAKENSIPEGETTRLLFRFQKPPTVPCIGRVLLEVSATKVSEPGLEEDHWLTQ